MAKEIILANESAPDDTGGAVWTTFFKDARPLTASMFTVATSKPATVTLLPEDPDQGLPERYSIKFATDLTPDEKELVVRIAQNNTNYQTLVAAAVNAYTDNQSWANTDYTSLINGANAIINAATTATNTASDKQLANGVKILADQVRDLCNQNRALMKLALGLNENPLG